MHLYVVCVRACVCVYKKIKLSYQILDLKERNM
jgi:hypothetical protein